MPSLLCAHIPWCCLAEQRSFLLQARINPEVYLSADALDSMPWDSMAAFSADLAGEGLSCTIHAPFMDLNPGSVDTAVRKITAQRVEQTLRAAELLAARVVVFHPGYSRLTYGALKDVWVERTIEFWCNYLADVQRIGCRVALENIFEEEPSTLRRVLVGINDPVIGHCFDSGHFNMFARVLLEDWFAELGSFVVEAHLHDNHGHADEHLPVGEGQIDFRQVTGLLKQYAPQAVWTLEAHSRERLVRSMVAIEQYMEEA